MLDHGVQLGGQFGAGNPRIISRLGLRNERMERGEENCKWG
jgi:hypothetical protein